LHPVGEWRARGQDVPLKLKKPSFPCNANPCCKWEVLGRTDFRLLLWCNAAVASAWCPSVVLYLVGTLYRIVRLSVNIKHVFHNFVP
jgi:hypothetical protein